MATNNILLFILLLFGWGKKTKHILKHRKDTNIKSKSSFCSRNYRKLCMQSPIFTQQVMFTWLVIYNLHLKKYPYKLLNISFAGMIFILYEDTFRDHQNQNYWVNKFYWAVSFIFYEVGVWWIIMVVWYLLPDSKDDFSRIVYFQLFYTMSLFTIVNSPLHIQRINFNFFDLPGHAIYLIIIIDIAQFKFSM